jgi:hypothetical protein
MIPAHMATFWHVAQAAPIQGTQLADVLRDNAPAGCCIDCLAAKLDFPVKELRDAAQVLVMRPAFRVFERVLHLRIRQGQCRHVCWSWSSRPVASHRRSSRRSAAAFGNATGLLDLQPRRVGSPAYELDSSFAT